MPKSALISSKQNGYSFDHVLRLRRLMSASTHTLIFNPHSRLRLGNRSSSKQIDFDPHSPSSSTSTQRFDPRLVFDFDPWLRLRLRPSTSTLVSSSTSTLITVLLFDQSAEQEGINANPIELSQFVDFIKRNKLQSESFFIGLNQYVVTSIHENWFSARCMNTSKPAGEGAIVMHTAAFLLVALYDGSIGSASRAMVAVDQFAWQLGRKNL